MQDVSCFGALNLGLAQGAASSKQAAAKFDRRVVEASRSLACCAARAVAVSCCNPFAPTHARGAGSNKEAPPLLLRGAIGLSSAVHRSLNCCTGSLQRSLTPCCAGWQHAMPCLHFSGFWLVSAHIMAYIKIPIRFATASCVSTLTLHLLLAMLPP